MASDIVKYTGISVAASKTNAVISKNVRLKDKFNLSLFIVLRSVVEAAAITFQLQDSYDGGKTWIDVGSESSVAVASAKSVASASDIDATDNDFDETAHGFVTGDRIVYKAGTAVVGGLVDGSTYYIIKTGTDVFKLASTQENAFNGIVVDLTTTGTGNQIFSQAVYQIRMIGTDTNDIAQLPFEDMIRVTCTTGSGDSCSVEAIFIADNA